MAGFIEDFYYGEHNPQEGMFPKYKDACRAYEKAEEAEKYLLQNLKGEFLEKFKAHIDATQDYYGFSAAYSYKKSFRDGARFTSDVFSDD